MVIADKIATIGATDEWYHLFGRVSAKSKLRLLYLLNFFEIYFHGNYCTSKLCCDFKETLSALYVLFSVL